MSRVDNKSLNHHFVCIRLLLAHKMEEEGVVPPKIFLCETFTYIMEMNLYSYILISHSYCDFKLFTYHSGR